MATRSLTLQTRHQSAVKSTKTGVPEARSSASRAVLNVSWRFPSATSPEAVAALGASGIPTVRTPASASEAGASVNHPAEPQIGSAACRERVCPYVEIWVVAVSLKTKRENYRYTPPGHN